MTTPWPWPGDTATERARRVAAAYRHALTERDPDGAATLDRRFAGLGEGWIAPPEATLRLDAELTVAEAAQYVGRARSVVYGWISDGRLPHRSNGSTIRVRVADLLDTYRDLRLGRSS